MRSQWALRRLLSAPFPRPAPQPVPPATMAYVSAAAPSPTVVDQTTLMKKYLQFVAALTDANTRMFYLIIMLLLRNFLQCLFKPTFSLYSNVCFYHLTHNALIIRSPFYCIYTSRNACLDKLTVFRLGNVMRAISLSPVKGTRVWSDVCVCGCVRESC